MQETIVQISVKKHITVYEGYAEYGVADWESRPITPLSLPSSLPPSLPPSLPSIAPSQGTQGTKVIQALVNELQAMAQHDDKSPTDPPTHETILSLPPIYEEPDIDQVFIN